MTSLNSKKYPLLLIAFIGLAIVFFLAFLPACSSRPKATPAPSLTLTNQFAQTISLSQLKGKVIVLTFLYTHCPETCPLIIFKVQQAMTELGSPVDEVALVAVTVDPERDTVERLREYTSSLSFDWQYLTGEPGQVRVAWDNYGIYVEPQKKKMTIEDQSHAGHQGYEVIHSTKVVLIDKEGFQRATLFGEGWQAAELEEKLRRLLAGQKIPDDFHLWRSFVSFLYRCGPISFSSLGEAVGHFIYMLSIPAVLFGLYRLLVR